MKRCFELCLAFLLLLGGCAVREEAPATQTKTEPIRSYTEDWKNIEPSIIEDWEDIEISVTVGYDGEWLYLSDASNFATFYDGCQYGHHMQITIRHMSQEGNSVSHISYDGNHYTITDENGERVYSYLIHSSIEFPQSDSYDYAAYFLLSNDPEMSAERYFDHLASSFYISDFPATEIVLSDFMNFDRTGEFGQIPKEFQNIENALMWSGGIYTPNYLLSYESTMLRCYNYKGELLWQSEGFGSIGSGTGTELSNGNVVFCPYSEGNSTLCCYNPEGELVWAYVHPDADVSICGKFILQRGDRIFTFGTAEGVLDDIYLGCFSLEGELLMEKTIGGSDFEWISRVQPCDEGILLLGTTQSGDGDLPLSKDGYGVDFSILVTPELELEDLKEMETAYAKLCGWYEGSPVYGDDSLFEKADNYTDYPTGIFAYEDGYVTVQTHALEEYKYKNPAKSHVPYYRELVFSGYDGDGKLLWRSTSNIYVS